jgi:hypothetical protein
LSRPLLSFKLKPDILFKLKRGSIFYKHTISSSREQRASNSKQHFRVFVLQYIVAQSRMFDVGGIINHSQV